MNRDKIRAAALKASKGKRHFNHTVVYRELKDGSSVPLAGVNRAKDAELIALTDPDTMLKLLGELDAKDKEIKGLRGQIETARGYLPGLAKTALKALNPKGGK